MDDTVRITTRTNIKGNKVFCFDKSHHGSLIDTFKEKDVTEVVGWPITNIVL
jgi:hypothetical protein